MEQKNPITITKNDLIVAISMYEWWQEWLWPISIYQTSDFIIELKNLSTTLSDEILNFEQLYRLVEILIKVEYSIFDFSIYSAINYLSNKIGNNFVTIAKKLQNYHFLNDLVFKFIYNNPKYSVCLEQSALNAHTYYNQYQSYPRNNFIEFEFFFSMANNKTLYLNNFISCSASVELDMKRLIWLYENSDNPECIKNFQLITELSLILQPFNSNTTQQISLRIPGWREILFNNIKYYDLIKKRMSLIYYACKGNCSEVELLAIEYLILFPGISDKVFNNFYKNTAQNITYLKKILPLCRHFRDNQDLFKSETLYYQKLNFILANITTSGSPEFYSKILVENEELFLDLSLEPDISNNLFMSVVYLLQLSTIKNIDERRIFKNKYFTQGFTEKHLQWFVVVLEKYTSPERYLTLAQLLSGELLGKQDASLYEDEKSWRHCIKLAIFYYKKILHHPQYTSIAAEGLSGLYNSEKKIELSKYYMLIANNALNISKPLSEHEKWRSSFFREEDQQLLTSIYRKSLFFSNKLTDKTQPDPYHAYAVMPYSITPKIPIKNNLR